MWLLDYDSCAHTFLGWEYFVEGIRLDRKVVPSQAKLCEKSRMLSIVALILEHFGLENGCVTIESLQRLVYLVKLRYQAWGGRRNQ